MVSSPLVDFGLRSENDLDISWNRKELCICSRDCRKDVGASHIHEMSDISMTAACENRMGRAQEKCINVAKEFVS